ncbi:uncharacterized protein LOC117228392 isoform X2 [Megalopta genalis]|uniref:uncharacterized protein LOC117228392 isoform X2 n=1 Tax=Megalopta genalis TaxID=115081 RepID=UPI003FD5FB50
MTYEANKEEKKKKKKKEVVPEDLRSSQFLNRGTAGVLSFARVRSRLSIDGSSKEA